VSQFKATKCYILVIKAGFMSSNMRLKKVCAFCKKVFIAKTTVTQCCSDACSKKNYKRRQRDEKLADAQNDTKEQMQSLLTPLPTGDPVTDYIEKELINIIELSIVTGLSERTLFRLIKDPKFPKFRVGKRLLFKKELAMNYLTYKYSNL
jgi:hypothetical protein